MAGSGPGTGRDNIFSYTRDLRNNDRWWRTTNNVVVTEVSKDEVFNDHTGVLLGGGPYFVVYSRDEEVDLLDWKDDTVVCSHFCFNLHFRVWLTDNALRLQLKGIWRHGSSTVRRGCPWTDQRSEYAAAIICVVNFQTVPIPQ